MFIRPAPKQYSGCEPHTARHSESEGAQTIGVAVDCSAAFACAVVWVGWAARYSASAADTAGTANEPPDNWVGIKAGLVDESPVAHMLFRGTSSLASVKHFSAASAGHGRKQKPLP